MKKSSMKIGRTILCGGLVLSLVLGSTPTVEVDAKKVTKQESVYVNAGADGSVSKVTVSDWLKNSGAVSGGVKDRSQLSDIKNVKGEETFTQNGDALNWNTSGADIYYQGTTEKKLPVELSITYKLDGQKMNPEDMLGKSGKVEIHVSYKNKSKATKTVNGEKTQIYTPFVMVTGMILENDRFNNIKISNGKVINEGTNSIVVGLGVPGLSESLDLKKSQAKKLKSDFTVTADVEDFSMGNTFTYGSADLFGDLELKEATGLDDLEDKLDDMTDATAKLVKGSGELSDNMELFADKMGDLKSSVKTYQNTGVKKLTKGISKLAKNGPVLVKGVGDYVDGADTLADGTTAYVDGAGKIADGNIALYEAVKDLPGQLQTFDTGLTTYTQGVDQLGSKENIEKVKGGAQAVAAGITTLNTSLEQLEQTYANNEKIIAALEGAAAQDPQLAAVVGQLKTVTAAQKQAITDLKNATGADSQLKTGADSLSTGVSTVMDSLGQLSANSESLRTASATLNKSMPTLVGSIKTLKEGSETLNKNNKKLTKGAKQLKKAGKKMNKSTKTLNKGMKKLNKGGKQLNKATVKLVDGVFQLEEASGKLDDGSQTLHSGMIQFNKEAIKKLKKIYENKVKDLTERLEAIADAGEDYKSFSGIGDGMKGEVKFIIETEAIENE